MMKFKVMLIILILYFFGLIAALMSEEIDATSSDNDETRRILGGSEVTPHSIPYLASLDIIFEGKYAYCVGSLITRRAVLTAAHCVPRSALRVMVTLGAHWKSYVKVEPTQLLLESTDWIVHPSYNGRRTRHNIAIVKLRRSVELNEYIQLIPLQSKSEIRMSFVNKTGTVSGWGLNSNGTKSYKLRSVSARIISNEECRKTIKSVRRSHICLEVGDKGTCQGDSGGPLTAVINNQVKQIGIASYTLAGGCIKNQGSVFTRVAHYLNWIKANNVLSTNDFKIRIELLLILSLLIILF